jgi:NADH:ubiquinone reductase (non-electrogenic)
MEPVRNFLRHKKASVKFYEAEATKIDYVKKIVYIDDDSEIKGDVSSTEVAFDMLVVGVGAENATFGMFVRFSVNSETVRRRHRLS